MRLGTLLQLLWLGFSSAAAQPRSVPKRARRAGYSAEEHMAVLQAAMEALDDEEDLHLHAPTLKSGMHDRIIRTADVEGGPYYDFAVDAWSSFLLIDQDDTRLDNTASPEFAELRTRIMSDHFWVLPTTCRKVVRRKDDTAVKKDQRYSVDNRYLLRPCGVTALLMEQDQLAVGLQKQMKAARRQMEEIPPAMRKMAAASLSCDASQFPTSLVDKECFGLARAAANSSKDCVESCCASESCEIWNWCGDPSGKACDADHGGCYIGASEDCQDRPGWIGGRKPPPPAPPQQLSIDLGAIGLRWEGIGGITSNGECRMLYDYPEPQRSNILDYLFLPSFGLSSQILKVEIGSDAQSTVGTEPAYQHERGVISYDRGIQFWLLKEAKRRNPNITIAALEWSAPGWVGNGSFFSDENIDYIMGWMHGATNVTGVPVDYMGVWNEPPIQFVPPAWLKSLRSRLDQHGYSDTQIIAPDWAPTGGVTLTLLKDMVGDADLRKAVDVIGTHGYWSGGPPKDFSTLQSHYGTRAWVSESWHMMGTWKGAVGMVDRVMTAHLQGNYTGWTAWGLLFAAYSNVLCQDKGLMYATNPWGAASYNVQPTIFATAHFTQFTRVGWRILMQGSGSGLLGKSGASVMTVVDDEDSSRFSTIVNAFDLVADTLEVDVAVQLPKGRDSGSRSSSRLQLWTTQEHASFVRGADIPLAYQHADGYTRAHFTLRLQAGALYSLTTLPGGVIAKGHHDHSELPSLFPLPHSDSFDAYATGRSPVYFTDWDGSFSVEEDTAARAKSMVLRQLVVRRPIKWHCTDVDPITLVMSGYQNYRVQTKARIDSSTEQSYSSTYVAVWARVLRPYHGWCPASSGYSLRLGRDGNWSLLVAPAQSGTNMRVLASGSLSNTAAAFDSSAWHELALSCAGQTISASIDGQTVAQVQDATFDSGSAGLGSGFHYASFDDFSLTPTRPLTYTVSSTTAPKPQLAAFCTFAGVQLSTTESGVFGFAFTVLSPIRVTHFARFATGNSSHRHQMWLVEAPTNGTTTGASAVLANATVDMSSAASLDALGFVYAALPEDTTPVLAVGKQYYITSEETAGGDPFHTLAAAQPCAGSLGLGGTLPRMNVPVKAIRIDGGVKGSVGGVWEGLYPDWEARSFGPVSFRFHDV